MYGTIVGRIDIILSLTGIVIAFVSKMRDFHPLSNNMVNYVWIGLIVAGVILLVIFISDFALDKHRGNVSSN